MTARGLFHAGNIFAKSKELRYFLAEIIRASMHHPPLHRRLPAEQKQAVARGGREQAGGGPDFHALANNPAAMQRRAAPGAPMQRWFGGKYYWVKKGDTYEWQEGEPDLGQLEDTGETRHYSQKMLWGRWMGNFKYPVYEAKAVAEVEGPLEEEEQEQSPQGTKLLGRAKKGENEAGIRTTLPARNSRRSRS
ncbi:MAG: hypothetical protein D6722_00665 [Bacteroidetes bacterium]|nr:MAG: hypothetical protein D6722_00665 [Bacteroidota bacterium]